ncbi:MAG: fibronectin type III domain-containing protein [Bacteroidota bacterium]
MINLKKAGTFLVLVLLATSFVFSQSPAQKASIAKQYDKAKLEALGKRLLKNQQAAKDQVVKLAAQNGWPTSYLLANGFGHAEIVKIGPNGKPIYYQTDNVDAATSTRVDHLNSGGSLGLSLDGQGMTAHVWDGGATRETHQEFDGPGGNNRVTQGDGATSLSDHATHVTGTIVASGFTAAAQGMATHAQAETFDWNSDLAEMTTEASSGMLISNHSYGYGWRNQFGQIQLPAWYGGAYIAESRDLDEILYNAPYYMMFSSGGNDGDDNTANTNPLDGNSNYDKLNAFKCSKNNVVVAAANDANVNADGTLNSYSIASFSSEGPTDDYRIKPDITGNGVGLYSPLSTSNSAYGTYSGTSMSSPNVAGSALLLQQHYNNVKGSFMLGATLKALILHTAEDGGSNGPDAIYGWGLMNAKAAAEAINDEGNTSMIQELTLNQGQSYQITVSAAGGPLFASICWTDPAGTANTGTANLTTPVLVNDLDIRVTQNSDTYLPWALTSITTNAQQDNDVDPYERVDINNASGSYTITVTHKGSLSSGSQAFSLVVTGLTACTLAAPGNLTSSNVGDNSFDLSWNAVSGANGYTVTIGGSSTTVSGTSYSATGLTAGTSYDVSVSANCSGGGSGTAATTNVTTTGTTPLNCSGTVSSFPYAEGFESGAAWTQEGGDDGDWVHYSGSTPSSSTGPGSASEGSFYLYLEASTNGTPGQIGNNATAILGSPCFDLSGASSADFSFDYHMYGSNMGSLTVEATNDDQTWSNIWSLSGNQGNQWNSASIDLSSYAGGTVKLRFVGTTGPGWQSDLAIDDVSLTTGGGGDTQAPSVPTGLVSSNVTSNSFDVSWNASTDNVGVTGYTVYLDGVSQGTTTGTSYSFSGLNASTSYDVTVDAFDAAGNTSAQSSALSVTTSAAPDTDPPSVPAGLASSNITTSSFDVSWNASTDNVGVTGYTVYLDGASQGTTTGTSYSFSGLNSSTSYDVTVDAFDAAGNTSAQSSALSVTTSAAPDTDPPSVPAGLASSNITTSSFDVFWNASTDNVGVTGYTVYLDGASQGTTTGTSYSFSGLNASTSYDVTVDAFDAAGNTSAQSSALSVTTQSGGGNPTVISASYFETGWDDWNDGGQFNNRASNATHAWEGTRTNRIRNGTSSSLTTSDPFDLSSFSAVEVDFHFRPVGMENGEYFELQYNDGSGFVTVATWVKDGSTINNNTFYQSIITLNSSSYNLSGNASFRFQNFANANNDRIFLDAIIITGDPSGSNSVSGFTVEVSNGSNEVQEISAKEVGLHIYPNPVQDMLYFEVPQEIKEVLVVNMAGQVVMRMEGSTDKLNVSSLSSGVYVLTVPTENGKILRKKFIKQ